MPTEPTESDLLNSIKDSLTKQGTINKINAELRAGILNILNRSENTTSSPQIPQETRLINELIREYLTWNGYIYSEQVLSAETGQNSERLTRDVLTTKFGCMDDERTAKIPLIYYIVSTFQNNNSK